MNYLKQIVYELRHQPMVTWISITGTALSLFLVMVVFMVNHVNVAEVAPESNRPRLFYGQYIDMANRDGNGSSSGSFNYEVAKMLYDGLDGVDKISYVSSWSATQDVNIAGQGSIEASIKKTDEVFWDIYDYNFSGGRAYDHEAVEAGAKEAVITTALAEKLWGKGVDPVGETVYIDLVPYTVMGAVDNVSPILAETYADLFIAFSPAERNNTNMDYFGDVKTVLLAKAGVDQEHLSKQVEARYATFNSRLKNEGLEAIYHGGPFDVETMTVPMGSNSTPDIQGKRNNRWVCYGLLLLLPAINLSIMTRSRLRRRVSEIGVRRAFGCRRSEIVWQLLTENLLVTLIGAAIGLVLSFLFTLLLSNFFVSYTNSMFAISLDTAYARPTFGMLFSWEGFGFAIIFCLILNILSAGLPAWKAASVNPAEALCSRGK